ncbi:TPA: hypothetical protein DCL30_00885 [Candidatus Peribacteria bacterium]|nr:MAG: hypothetical protein A3J91_00890 [Candidatus Peribacteria bacterium RIFOXYC2_FULL_58_10]OGJ85177.1 MAG: hypothetical protein A2529_01805 [Candidatus Peribacteria bacterium RIFOXYD2_FULL_58_15]HAI98084.1 hypothetical protein [Candidatus Peribacteria bacterium]HAS33874.1 hypothetical protein [Candidatus Peribacteria bacterium]
MNPREIVAKSWAITKGERQLRHWGYASSLLETLLNVKLLIYQVWFLISYIEGDPIGFFTVEATLFEYVPLWFFITFVIGLIILICIEWLFPNMGKGAIIGLAAKSYQKEEVKGGLVLGIYNFFPIFAIHEFFFLSRISMVITLISLLLRYGGGMAPVGIAIVIIAFLFSNILRFFFVFSEEAVVIRKLGIGKALKASFKLVISYLGHVVFLMLLSLLISIRVFLNVLMVLLIPGIVIGIGFLLSLIFSQFLTIIIGLVLGLILVGLASYLFAYIEVFGQTVWTLTYIELSKLKELDVIEVK